MTKYIGTILKPNGKEHTVSINAADLTEAMERLEKSYVNVGEHLISVDPA